MSISRKNHSKDVISELWRDNNMEVDDKEKQAYLDAFDKYDSVACKFREGRLGVEMNGLWGVINEDGEEIFRCQFRDCPIFVGGYARINYGRHYYGLIDRDGNFPIPAEYDNVKAFDEDGFAQFEKGIYWGTIDKDGNKHILPRKKFQQIGSFVNGIAPAKIETKWGLINAKGEHITKFEYYEINRCQGVFYVYIIIEKYTT